MVRKINSSSPFPIEGEKLGKGKKPVLPAQLKVAEMGKSSLQNAEKSASSEATSYRWTHIKNWFGVRHIAALVSYAYRIFNPTPLPKRMAVDDNVALVSSLESEAVFDFVQSLHQELLELHKNIDSHSFENSDDYSLFLQELMQLQDVRGLIDELSKASPQSQLYLDETLDKYNETLQAANARMESLAASALSKRMDLEEIGLDKVPKENLAEYYECAKFLAAVGLLKEEDKAFAREIWSILFNEPSVKELPAVETSPRLQQAEVEARLNDEAFCSPQLRDKIKEDPELMDLIMNDLSIAVRVPSAEVVPAGLTNQGNSCYRNSSHQMLLHSPLAARFEQSVCESANLLVPAANIPIEDAIVDIKAKLKISNAFKELLNGYADLQESSGEDVYEVQQRMTTCDRNLLDAVIDSRFILDLDQNSRFEQQDAAAYVEMLFNVFGVLFRLQETYLNPPELGLVSMSETPYPMIQLPIAVEASIQDLVHANYQLQEIDNIKWKNKQEQILGAPSDTLTIQLKRRGFNREKMAFEYLNDPVEVASDIIDMSEAYGKAQGSLYYALTGFVAYHPFDKQGKAGHYISYVRKGGDWYQCNDSRISNASEEEISQAKEGAYLLMLEKI
jgi:hypothetical protein